MKVVENLKRNKMVNALNHTQSTSSKIKTKKMYVSTPINRVQEVETRLNKIFKEELDSEGSILVSYKPEVVSKLARFILGHVNR